MDTLQLKMFVSLSQTLNFTKTAAEFYVSQPTVSNYVKALEAGVVIRSSRGLGYLLEEAHD